MTNIVIVLTLFLSVLCLSFFLFGSYRFVHDVEENRCNMTYMYPGYVKLPFSANVKKKFPHYNLYLYEERRGQFKGIPILFVPGNAGSYAQVRSAGSVAFYISLNTSYHFSFFSVDFNEELSALFGGVLADQTAFLHECIKYIKQLYNTEDVKIAIIGHSMGGVIVRSLLISEEFNPADISIVITKASPHRPILLVDPFLDKYYDKLNSEWQNKRYTDLQNISFLSIAGGNRDLLVRTDLTVIPTSQKLSDISIPSQSIPEVWVSTDHLSIIWCKQLVLTVVRTLFDLVDPKTKQFTSNITLHQDVLKYHFLQKSMDDEHYPRFAISPETFSTAAEWIIKLERSWRFTQNKAIAATHLLVDLVNDEHIVALATGLKKRDWVYACNPEPFVYGVKPVTCSQSENLVKKTDIIPTKSNSNRRLVYIKSETYMRKGFSHLLIISSPSGCKVNILCEKFKFRNRQRNIILPEIPQSLFSRTSYLLLNVPLTEGAVFYNLKFINLNQIWQVYKLVLEIPRCKSGIIVQGVAEFIIPWSNEKYFYILSKHTEIPLKLNIPNLSNPERYAKLYLFLDPECSFTLTVHTSVILVAQQLVKFFALLVPGYIVSLTLAAFSMQLFILSTVGVCPSFQESLDKFPSLLMLVILPLGYFTMREMGYLPHFLPLSDDSLLKNEGLFFLGLRPILYLTAYGTVVIFSTVQCYIITRFSYCYRVKYRLNRKHEETKRSKKSYLLPLILIIVFSVSALMTGSLCLLFGLLINSYKLICCCGKSIIEEDRRGPSFNTRKWHFKMTVNHLLLCSFLLSIASIVVWIHGIRHSIILHQDTNRIPSVLVILTCFVFWKSDAPSSNRYGCKFVSYLLFILAVLTSFFGLIKLYYNIYFITIALSIVALQHIFIRFVKRVKED